MRKTFFLGGRGGWLFADRGELGLGKKKEK